MSVVTFFAGSLLSISILASAEAQREWPVTCDRSLPPFTYQGASLETLVDHADAVVLAAAASYEPQVREDGLEGVYEFIIHWSLKGDPDTPLRMAGLGPPDAIPQHYLDLTEQHAQFDSDTVFSFRQTLIENGRDCDAATSFVLGYDYLIFVGLDSFVSFEPIHSPRQDAWYLAVERATEEYGTKY